MTLQISLNRDRFYWMKPALTPSDDVIVTIDVVGSPTPAHLAIEVALGSAMRAIAPVEGAVPTSSGITVDLGDVATSEKRTLHVRIRPKPASRPGRRRVAVVRVVANGEVADSTTVWARVERES